ncbi:hypothetical protein ACJIZ3_019858 [Penstemon smallii]|uniref:Anthocyanin acyltransferase n=1 Tax=Penstemon smallii TaxID=265156 RepID=A0ABD3T383_9LAMI
MADTILLECCKISPPHNANVAEYSLPVVFFDMLFYEIPPNKSVLFFKFPCSKSHFLETIVPNLRKSLSSTLRHFLPLVGTISHSKNGKDKPISRYVSGDSVCFTVCESKSDLNHLTGNHPRICDEFYSFTPDLPPATTNLDLSSISRPVLAVQVTLFPGQGVSIGFVTHHVMADASTVVSLMKAWSLINVLDDDDEKTTRLLLEEANCLPFFDRKNVVDFNGLDSIYWDVLLGKVSSPLEPPPLKFPTGKIRSTFVLKKEEIQNLKKYVSSNRPQTALTKIMIIIIIILTSKLTSRRPIVYFKISKTYK